MLIEQNIEIELKGRGAPGGSLHAHRYLSNVRYSKNNKKWYYMLRK